MNFASLFFKEFVVVTYASTCTTNSYDTAIIHKCQWTFMSDDKKLVEEILKTTTTPTAKLLWLFLRTQEKEENGFFRFNSKELAKIFGHSTRQVTRALDSLEECRLVEKDYRWRTYSSSLFRLNLALK